MHLPVDAPGEGISRPALFTPYFIHVTNKLARQNVQSRMFMPASSSINSMMMMHFSLYPRFSAHI
jgi:hypothetical protein